MKKTALLFAFILSSLLTFGQEVVIDNIATVRLPTLVKKLSGADRAAIKNNAKFGDNILVNSMQQLGSNSPDVYNADNILIKLDAEEVTNISHDYLSKVKTAFDAMSLENQANPTANGGYSSVIKKIGNNEILIFTYVNKDLIKYIFYTYSRNSALTGEIVFNKTDEPKAKIIFDDILKSVKFIK